MKELLTSFKGHISPACEKKHTLLLFFFFLLKNSKWAQWSGLSQPALIFELMLTQSSVCILVQGLKISICSFSVGSIVGSMWEALRTKRVIPSPFFCCQYKSVNEDKSNTLEVTVRQIIVILAVRDGSGSTQSFLSYREWQKFQLFFLLLLSLMGLPVPGGNAICLLDEITNPSHFI